VNFDFTKSRSSFNHRPRETVFFPKGRGPDFRKGAPPNQKGFGVRTIILSNRSNWDEIRTLLRQSVQPQAGWSATNRYLRSRQRRRSQRCDCDRRSMQSDEKKSTRRSAECFAESLRCYCSAKAEPARKWSGPPPQRRGLSPTALSLHRSVPS